MVVETIKTSFPNLFISYSLLLIMKSKINIKIIIFSVIALGFLVLTFTIDWLFIIPAVILMILNQKELMKDRGK